MTAVWFAHQLQRDTSGGGRRGQIHDENHAYVVSDQSRSGSQPYGRAPAWLHRCLRHCSLGCDATAVECLRRRETAVAGESRGTDRFRGRRQPTAGRGAICETWMLGLPVSADASRNPSPSAVPAHHVGVLSCTRARPPGACSRSEEHTSELQSLAYLVCRLLLEKKKKNTTCDLYNTILMQKPRQELFSTVTLSIPPDP